MSWRERALALVFAYHPESDEQYCGVGPVALELRSGYTHFPWHIWRYQLIAVEVRSATFRDR
jgi:hypothetical protein